MLPHVSFRDDDEIFIVRTWLEVPNDGRTMRGRIDHVASGRRRYFANFGDLCDFIASSDRRDSGSVNGVRENGAIEPDEDSGAVDGPETVPG
jgi:hypothetical protein